MTDLNDPLNLREKKPAKKTLMQRLTLWAGVGGLCLAAAFGGIYLSTFAEKASIDYRTDVSTEVHRVQGEVYVHLGDHKPVTRVPLGGNIYIHNVYIKTETCHGFTSNVFWGVDNHVVVHYSMFTNWFKAGHYEAEELYKIPTDLPPGLYKITKKTVSICNGREHYTTNFDIVAEFYKPTK